MCRPMHSLAVPAAIRHLFLQQKSSHIVYAFIRKTEVGEQGQYHSVDAGFTVINGSEKIDASIMIDSFEQEMCAAFLGLCIILWQAQLTEQEQGISSGNPFGIINATSPCPARILPG